MSPTKNTIINNAVGNEIVRRESSSYNNTSPCRFSKPAKLDKSWGSASDCRNRLSWCTTRLPRPSFRIFEHQETAARCFAASNSRPSTDNSYQSVDIGTGRRVERCCSRNTSHTAKRNTTRSILARSGFYKAPNVGAYPPVKRGCSLPRLLCSRCPLCFSPYGVSCCLWWAWVAVAGVAVSCSWRCSCTGWRGFRCPTKTMARPFRSWVVDQRLCSTIPVERSEFVELVSWIFGIFYGGLRF